MSSLRRPFGREARACALLVSAFVLTGCHGERSTPRARAPRELPPLSVSTTTARSLEAGGARRVAAVAEPAHRATLATNLMARVVDVRVVEGQRVEEGAPLLRLDVRDLRARRGQAEASAEAQRAQAELASSGLRRTRLLEERGAVAEQQRETAETSATAIEASVRGAESALRELDVRLGESVLRAPFSGLIVQKHTEVGSFAAPGQPLLVLEDDSTLRILAPIAHGDSSRLSQGQAYTVTFGTGDERQGVLDAIVSSGNPRSPGLVAVFLVANEDHRLRAGVVASVEIPAPPTNAIAFEVPEQAVLARGGLRGVFVVRDGRAELVWCSIDARVRAGKVEVLDGLREGDVLVADARLPGLADGRRVTVSR